MIRFRANAVSEIKKAAAKHYPSESCGMLGGKNGIVTEVVEIKNRAAQPNNSFRFDPKEMIRTLRSFDQRGLEWYGIFHSHPAGTATPSSKDTEQWNFPDLYYCIASIDTSLDIKLQLFLWKNHRFFPIPLTKSAE